MFPKLDLILTLSSLLLLSLGIAILSSVAPDLLPVQISAAVIGIILYLIISKIDFRIWTQFNRQIYILSIIFLVLPFIFGTAAGGARSWLQFGTLVSIQPSEIIRPFILIILAATLSNQSRTSIKNIILSIFLLTPPAAIIFLQPDLGLAITLLIGWLGIILSHGLTKKQVIAGLLLIGILLPVSWQILQPYQKNRVLTFINPDRDPLNTGYHVLQSQIAVGSGQIWGRGLGRGSQSHLRFLPERHTDFIFASMAEEFGLVGSIAIIFLYLVLFSRFISAITAPDTLLPKLIASGLLATTLFQVFVNIGMNLGILPITGVTLPLLSYGGSSIIATFITLGIINQILTTSRHQSDLHIH